MRFAAIIIVIFTCTAQAQTMSNDDFERMLARQAAIDRFVRTAPTFIQGKSLEDFRKIGDIHDEIIKTVPNPHVPTKTDEFRTLKFDGLEIYGLVHSPKEFWPIKLTVFSPRWKILNDLNVGSPAQLIYDALGNPTKQSDDLKQYCGETECVNFQIKGGVISKIVFNYYAD
jgi:hypothetical protein